MKKGILLSILLSLGMATVSNAESFNSCNATVCSGFSGMYITNLSVFDGIVKLDIQSLVGSIYGELVVISHNVVLANTLFTTPTSSRRVGVSRINSICLYRLKSLIKD